MDLPLAQAVLDAQPFSKLLDARIADIGTEHVVLEVPVDDRFRQQYGLIHGGVLAYLADNSLTYAAALKLGESVLTSGFSIDYLAAARDGVAVRATATLVHGGRRKASARCEIEIVDADGNAELCAVAMGTALSTAA
ncbi:PaaI family thioesterase [Gordonia neofelifaecis]|uniref:Medium/long-chain acyl-CoA thioesterase YigI n=1 Tax=Gordonia neofelifaecis NRRL B-59395 TaxID=644548 RepID=F1YIY9_9ACTN|nr:PaaI family thioesterase [Gordonia neofelifaecis]EGD55436.1 putative phenylacetic acid degradation protein [Gordonia neofelifaecis NRRL B-59395]